MNVKIGKSQLKGTVKAPPSKSMTHRLLICGGLSKGKSIIHGVARSQDILATLDCLESLNAKYEFCDDTVIIEGIGDLPKEPILNCRESGSTLRFFIPICSALSGKAELFGSEKLLSRPLSVYESIFKEQNIGFENDGKSVRINGKISNGKYKIKGNISSQFISGLLFALPLLKKDSIIDIIPPIESCSYIDLTIEALKEFGISVKWLDERTLFIKGNQSYKAKETYVEGDFSNAAFFEAFNLFNNDVKIEGLNEKSIQGDKIYREFYPLLEKGTPTIHLGGCPDLGPILFAIAAAKNGAVFTGTRRLKLKESDRAKSMADELEKMGASVKIEENSVLVYPIRFSAPKEALCGHNDHRVVMALSVLLSAVGGEIEGAEAVNKSMPDFFSKMEKLGAKLEYTDKN